MPRQRHRKTPPSFNKRSSVASVISMLPLRPSIMICRDATSRQHSHAASDARVSVFRQELSCNNFPHVQSDVPSVATIKAQHVAAGPCNQRLHPQPKDQHTQRYESSVARHYGTHPVGRSECSSATDPSRNTEKGSSVRYGLDREASIIDVAGQRGPAPEDLSENLSGIAL
jgi:hypothetical protein